MKLIDISPEIHAGLAVFPGDVPFARAVSLDMTRGDHLTLSSLSATLHIGAHADAPGHYVADGDDIAARPLDLYAGECEVVFVENAENRRILPADLPDRPSWPERVLFRTDTFTDPSRWTDRFASLSPELVDHLAGRGVRLVGIDTPSVDPADSKLLESHQAIARHDMAILEGLVLSHVAPGRYELLALPLKIRGGDAAPCRAALRAIPQSHPERFPPIARG
jgi:arylformamidase